MQRIGTILFKFKYLVIGACLLHASNMTYLSHGNWWRYLMISDAEGYYAYLPAVFIYNDLQFSFLEEVEAKYDPFGNVYDYRRKVGDKYVNKYYVGTAICEMPFFLGAHLLSSLTKEPADGYSIFYLKSINVAAIFYFLAGLYFLELLLLRFNISKGGIFLTFLVLSFGTNSFYYVTVEPGMSHIYSFCLITAFVLYGFKLFEQITTKNIMALAILLALIVLVRPINGLIIFSIPFIAGSYKSLSRVAVKLFTNPVTYLGIGVTFFIMLTQFFIYYLQTGSFIVYSYGDEGFNFASPHFWDFLISYKKGFFLYTPVAAIACLGLIPMFLTNKFRALSLIVFLIFIIYILSSWWNWWYGGSFSCRVLLDYLVLFMLPFAILYEKLNFSLKLGLTVLSLCFITLNLIQIYQYRHNLIHWDNTSKEMYWENFLKLK